MSLEIMFEDHPIRKQAFLVSTNIEFTQWTYWDFFKGVNPWFWSQIGQISSQFDFGQMSLEIMFDVHPVRNKAFLNEKTHRFYTVDILGFLKGVTTDFGQNLDKFHLSLILDKWALKVSLKIIQLENKPSQSIQILILYSGHIEIF